MDPHTSAKQRLRRFYTTTGMVVLIVLGVVAVACDLIPTPPPIVHPPSSLPVASAIAILPRPGLVHSQVPPTPTTSPPATSPGDLPFNILIADRGNNRIIEVTPDKRIVWSFIFDGLPSGFGADDAFFTPGNHTIIANLEADQRIVEIDYSTRQIIWQYGTSDRAGAGPNQLNTPDDAYRLPDGITTVADIKNCRVVFISQDKRIVKQYGQTQRCRSQPGYLNYPNGDTPLPNGHMLITEIRGSRISEVDATGMVVWQFRAPVRYPSDAQLTPRGTILVCDYSKPGAILELTRTGQVLWEYRFPVDTPAALNRPSLAAELPNGNIIANDDFNHRVIVIDKASQRIIWQYGHTGQPGAGDDELNIPDGLDWRH